MTAEVVSIAVAAPTAPYGQHLAKATRFVDDAAAHLRLVAGALEAQLTELIGPAASHGAVTAAIRAAAERLRGAPSGLFVLAYAGHGGRVVDVSHDEADGHDEAWALDDAPLIDDVLGALLDEFHPDVHVVLIINCCYAAGMVDAMSAQRPAGEADVATNRVVIAGCGEHQMMVIPDRSRLTMRVLEAVFPLDGDAHRRQAVDYAAVEAHVTAMACVGQTPVVLASGIDKRRQAFVAQPRLPG